jgi:hypothetical protein
VSFVEEVWEKLGPEARKIIREATEAMDQLDSEARARHIGSIMWLGWITGYYDRKYGHRRLWGYVLPPEELPHPHEGPPKPTSPLGRVARHRQSRRVTAP